MQYDIFTGEEFLDITQWNRNYILKNWIALRDELVRSSEYKKVIENDMNFTKNSYNRYLPNYLSIERHFKIQYTIDKLNEVREELGIENEEEFFNKLYDIILNTKDLELTPELRMVNRIPTDFVLSLVTNRYMTLQTYKKYKELIYLQKNGLKLCMIEYTFLYYPTTFKNKQHTLSKAVKEEVLNMLVDILLAYKERYIKKLRMMEIEKD